MADWSENEANFSLRQAHEDKEVLPYVFDSEVPSKKKAPFQYMIHTPICWKCFFKKTFAQFQPLVSFS